jgi:3-oxoacyl-[acyl-carrier protein] reductase
MGGRLEGRVAIITGAGQGIGLAYANRFLDEGANVVMAELDEKRAADGLAALAKEGYGEDRVVLVRTDIADEESAQACADRAVERFGRIDALVNNAALYHDWDMGDQSLGYLRKVMDVNQHGAWLMTRAVAPVMVRQGRGHVVNQASTAAYNYRAMLAGSEFTGLGSDAYGQSKWGVIGLTKFTAAQLGPHGITVNCIAPGVIGTEATTSKMPPGALDTLVGMQALKVALTPEHLTGTAVYLVSDDARWVTGQVICIDGGRVMPA